MEAAGLVIETDEEFCYIGWEDEEDPCLSIALEDLDILIDALNELKEELKLNA